MFYFFVFLFFVGDFGAQEKIQENEEESEAFQTKAAWNGKRSYKKSRN
jgi:hypothetical protein